MTRRVVVVLAILAGAGLLQGCASQRCSSCAGPDDTAHLAHDAYVAAINSNNLQTVLDMLTDDVVFMPPNTPRLVGKDAVSAWAGPYLDAYQIHWEKTTLEFVVLGDWAFEQYAYIEDDAPKAGGPRLQDTGKGINIYHREHDGVWRVARDAWNSDLPLPQ